MPDAVGRLSPVEITAIQKWMIDRHGGTPYPCPVSGKANWYINEYVYQDIVFPVQATLASSVSSKAWPVVQVACADCGYTIYFNAGIIGLYPSPLVPVVPTPSPATE